MLVSFIFTSTCIALIMIHIIFITYSIATGEFYSYVVLEYYCTFFFDI